MKFKYSEQLPISAHREEIIEKIIENQVVVVVGETGSGKSTQIPKMILESLAHANKADAAWGDYKVICTQPRRIAATSIAEWVADDMNVDLGQEVGYKIRFDDDTVQGTLITICTDGILLQEMKSDNMLSRYDAVMVDEAHERNLNIDFLLGLLKDIQVKRVENGLAPLKILVTSATVDAAKFAQFFAGLNAGKDVPIINVSGRTYPVDIDYKPLLDGENIYKKIGKIIRDIDDKGEKGDVLIFMPGEFEIFSTIQAIDFMGLSGVKCVPLYSRLTMEDQHKIYDEISERKVVVATNIAETSLTVPGITYVIDSGLARITDFDFRTGIGSLEVKKVSKASSVQRAGRAGRVAPGTAIRLFSEEDFSERDDYTKPEIQRSDLASVVLHMILIGIHDVYNFNFIDPPDMVAFKNAYKVLHELGALDSDNNLTERGVKMAHLPLEPRISAMLLAAERYDVVRQVAVIASALSVKDLFIRPKDEEEEADAAKRHFQKLAGRRGKKFKYVKVRRGKKIIKKKKYIDDGRDEGKFFPSDLVTYLVVWNKVKGIVDLADREAYCQVNYLNYQILEEIEQIYFQLIDTLRTFAGQEFDKYLGDTKDLIMEISDLEGVLKSIATGLIQNLCEQSTKQSYRTGTSDDIFIHPGSALFQLNPKWFVSSEIVETTRLYARNNTVVDPSWFEEIAPHLCDYKYGNLEFDKRDGKVSREETVFFKGHKIVKKRRETLREQDKQLAFEFFIREALVKKGLFREFNFIEQNEQVRKNLERYAAMTRNEKYYLDQQRMFDWYGVKCAEYGIYPSSREELERLMQKHGENALLMKIDDFISAAERDKLEKAYPDEIYLNGRQVNVKYFTGHYKYPDGPVISLEMNDLFDLTSQKMKNLVKGNSSFRPYILICQGGEFINSVVEGFEIDDLKEEYDLYQLKKSKKKVRREIEVKGIRPDEVLPFFERILEKVEIGTSLFFGSGASAVKYSYTGIRPEGKKFYFTVFDEIVSAKRVSLDTLKELIKLKLRSKGHFVEDEIDRLDEKYRQNFEGIEMRVRLEELLWKEIDIDSRFKRDDDLKDVKRVSEVMKDVVSNIDDYKLKVVKRMDSLLDRLNSVDDKFEIADLKEQIESL